MEHYLLLKIVHSASSVLLLLGLLVHLFMLWKAHRGGDAAVLLRKLRNTRRYSSPALGLVVVFRRRLHQFTGLAAVCA